MAHSRWPAIAFVLTAQSASGLSQLGLVFDGATVTVEGRKELIVIYEVTGYGTMGG